MSDKPNQVNSYGDTAPLANVSLFAELCERVKSRHRDLPGMAVWYGPSGYGKTKSAIYGANVHRARYIEVGSSWTQVKFARALAVELGVPASGTLGDLVDRIIIAMKTLRCPLIIDEFDHIVSRKYVELVREIHDKSGGAIILIGEENLPHNLKIWERIHNRVLDWQPAQPCGAADAGRLAQMYAPGVTIADDLLARIVVESAGRPRRIAVNCDRVREAAVLEGWATVSLAEWGKRSLFSGDPPERRVV